MFVLWAAHPSNPSVIVQIDYYIKNLKFSIKTCGGFEILYMTSALLDIDEI